MMFEFEAWDRLARVKCDSHYEVVASGNTRWVSFGG